MSLLSALYNCTLSKQEELINRFITQSTETSILHDNWLHKGIGITSIFLGGGSLVLTIAQVCLQKNPDNEATVRQRVLNFFQKRFCHLTCSALSSLLLTITGIALLTVIVPTNQLQAALDLKEQLQLSMQWCELNYGFSGLPSSTLSIPAMNITHLLTTLGILP